MSAAAVATAATAALHLPRGGVANRTGSKSRPAYCLLAIATPAAMPAAPIREPRRSPSAARRHPSTARSTATTAARTTGSVQDCSSTSSARGWTSSRIAASSATVEPRPSWRIPQALKSTSASVLHRTSTPASTAGAARRIGRGGYGRPITGEPVRRQHLRAVGGRRRSVDVRVQDRVRVDAIEQSSRAELLDVPDVDLRVRGADDDYRGHGRGEPEHHREPQPDDP